MNHFHIKLPWLLVFFLLCFEISFSQTLKTEVDAAKDIGLKEIEKALSEGLENPATLNKILKSQLTEDSGLRFLKDLNIDFKTFVSNNSDSIKGLGLSYNYSKDVKFLKSDEKKRTSVYGFSLNFATKGNIAFNPDINPNDMISTNLSFSFFNSSGGVVIDNDTTYQLEKAIRLTKLTHIIALKDDPWNSKEWKEYLGFIRKSLTNQFYWDFSFKGGLESNQKFTNKNYTYGVKFGLDVKAWNNENMLAYLNVFDWPFALIRYFNNTDKDLTPRGSVIPTVMFSFERVEPVGEDPRFKAGDSSKYNRFAAEIGFKTVIVSIKDLKGYFEADFRFYKEINASDLVKAMNLDQYLFFTSAIKLSNGMFVSYSTGQLPFDKKKDQIYTLGFNFSL